MMNRADGQVGFIGGGVEEGESLEVAVTREVQEEIGHNIQTPLTSLVAHECETFTTHVFTSTVSYDQLKTMQTEAEKAEHFGSETTGLFLPHLFDYSVVKRKGAIQNLIANSLAYTVREELMYFLLAFEIFHLDDLTRYCHEAGYSLEELLH